MDDEADGAVEWLKETVTAVRTIRGEMNIAPSKKLSVILNAGSERDRELAQLCDTYLRSLAGIDSLSWLDGAEAPVASIGVVGDMEVLVPMAGLIDPEAEIARLGKEVTRLEQEIQRTGGKLANEKFVSKAPAEVVAKEQAKLADAKATLERIQAQIVKLGTI